MKETVRLQIFVLQRSRWWLEEVKHDHITEKWNHCCINSSFCSSLWRLTPHPLQNRTFWVSVLSSRDPLPRETHSQVCCLGIIIYWQRWVSGYRQADATVHAALWAAAVTALCLDVSGASWMWGGVMTIIFCHKLLFCRFIPSPVILKPSRVHMGAFKTRKESNKSRH